MPFSVVAVMFAVPLETAVILPVASTVATAVLTDKPFVLPYQFRLADKYRQESAFSFYVVRQIHLQPPHTHGKLVHAPPLHSVPFLPHADDLARLFPRLTR